MDINSPNFLFFPWFISIFVVKPMFNQKILKGMVIWSNLWQYGNAVK